MNKKIYFFCYPLGPPEKAGYQHQIVSLAEGLKELNVLFYSNINYWQENSSDNSYLLENDSSIDYHDCEVVVFSSVLIDYDSMHLLPKDLFDRSRKYKIILLDDSDGIITPGFDLQTKVDIVLKSHYNKKYKYPDNFRPWQFGLSNRIIAAVTPQPFTNRNKDVLVNFRVSHSVREMAISKVMPIVYRYLQPNNETDSIDENKTLEDQLNWHLSGRRHYKSFYQRLSNSVACACFGGMFHNFFIDFNGQLGINLSKINNKFRLFKPDRVFQNDSWRFWESLAAGCCTIHVDFEKYGILLPEMPVNGTHYLGIDFDDLSCFDNLLKERENIFEEVGRNGREWVLKFYSPKKIALRFLNIIEEK